MSVKANSTDAANAWVTGMQGAGPKYKAGVAAVKTAPGQLAAARADFWASQVAASKPKFQRNVGNVSLQSWQDSATNKGADRLGTGATAAQPRFEQFMGNFLGSLTTIVNGLPQRGTFEQNMQRSMSYAQALHAKKGTF